MATVTGANVTEWKMKEMARRSGVKYELKVKPILMLVWIKIN